jgi:repressor LexA
MRDLTQREKRVLQFIVERTRERGAPPTIREIGEAFRISSTNGVRYYLTALERKGYIHRNRRLSRGIELVGGPQAAEVKVVGRVAAGQPILAEENVEDTLLLDRSVVRDGSVFALAVRGDSMVGAGILPGDRILVRQQRTADPGDIVVALLGDEATVKRFRPETGRVVLEAENPAYAPIVVDDTSENPFSLVGKVIGVLRVYR